jgi:hypothetical protein
MQELLPIGSTVLMGHQKRYPKRKHNSSSKLKKTGGVSHLKLISNSISSFFEF